MESPNILVVDDEQVSLETIGMMIEAIKYDYQLADNSEKCLELLNSNKFHILITDLAMPKIEDGITLIEKVNQEYPSIVIIVHSGYSDQKLIIKTLSQKKAYDYLIKNTDLDTLKFSIDRAFEHYTLNFKLNSIKQEEEKFFKDMLQIFDWKKELENKYVDSTAPSLIRQININMLQGGGFGALISVLGIFLQKIEYQPEKKGYFVSEKIVKSLKFKSNQ